MKLEVEDTRLQRQEIIEWPRITESNMYNNDDEETIPWSPRPDLITEGTSSRNDTTSTVPWIDVIPRNNSHTANSLDERSVNESESEREENSTVRLHLKTAYVAIKKLKLPGIKFPMKTTKKKKRRKMKPRAKWSINLTARDTDWTPLPAKRMSTKI